MSDADGSILVVRWRRSWAVVTVLVTACLGALCATMAWAAWPEREVVSGITGLLTLLMAAGCVRGVRLLLRPPLMFMADADGVVTYLEDGDYGGDGFRIPWTQIDAIGMETRLAAGGGSARVRTVTLQLAERYEAPGRVSVGGSNDRRTVHLDATSGDLRGPVLRDRLTRMLERAGGPVGS